jgi:hypothetical protein
MMYLAIIIFVALLIYVMIELKDWLESNQL